MSRTFSRKILAALSVAAATLPAWLGAGVVVSQAAPVRMAKLVPSTMTFSPPTLVDPQYFGREPSIWIDEHGVVFVSAIYASSNSTTFVWRSKDSGRTYQLLDARLPGGIADPRHRPCTLSDGGADSDIITDRTGRVYMADLENFGVAVNWSTDGGDTWQCTPKAFNDFPPYEDRQWMAPATTADGEGPGLDAYLSYRPLVEGIELDVTYDGGATWVKQNTYALDSTQNGQLFTYKDGTLYHAFYETSNDGGATYLARSEDQGKTFKELKVADTPNDPGIDFTAADVDDAGNLYYAWVEDKTFDVMFARSFDRGDHWTKPVRMNPPASEVSAFPWIAAGKKGDAAVAWYGTSQGTDPSTEHADAPWRLWVARTLDGTAKDPAFEVGPMTKDPMHFGTICLMGLLCAAPPEGDRTLGDFFEIDIAPDGTLMAAYNDNGRLSNPPVPRLTGAYVVAARQETGLGLTGARAAGYAVEPRGDALFPTHDPSGRSVASLDLSEPAARASGGKLRVEFGLADARDLSTALEATSQGMATDAYWVATWAAHSRREYAVMHYSQLTGTTEFYGGDEPQAATRAPNDEKYATYPSEFTIDGKVDTATGRVTLEAPLSAYGLSPADSLSGVQVFAMTGLLPLRTFKTALDVFDVTTAKNASLAAPAVLGSKRTPDVSKPVPGTEPGPRGRLAGTGVASGTGVAIWLLAGAAMLAIFVRRRAFTR